MKQILSISAILLLVACNKDKFETKPQLTLESVSTNEVTRINPLNLTLEFTDKEGDVTDTLFLVRQRLNKNGPVILPASPYLIPDFPKTVKGNMEIKLDYDRDLTLSLDPIRIPGSNPTQNEYDTMRLKIVVKDRAGNSSDTLTIDDIFVERL